MIKLNTVGMIENSKLNGVLKSTNAVKNYSFLAVDGVDYLIANTVSGDDWGKEDLEFKAGEFLNGWNVATFKDEELVIDAKHIKFTGTETYETSITPGTTLFTIDATTGKIAIAAAAPSAGVYFKCTAKCRLTEKAIKAKVMYA